MITPTVRSSPPPTLPFEDGQYEESIAELLVSDSDFSQLLPLEQETKVERDVAEDYTEVESSNNTLIESDDWAPVEDSNLWRTPSETDSSYNTRLEYRERQQEIAAQRQARRHEREHMEDIEIEREDVTKAADRLFALLVSRWEGCGREKHEQDAMDNIIRHPDQGDLTATYNIAHTASTYTSSVGLSRAGFPREKGVPRDVYARPEVLQSLFEGTQQDSTTPARINLETEATVPSFPVSTSDADSTIIISQTLEVFKKPVKVCVVYDVSRNISSTLHLPLDITIIDEQGVLVQKELYINEVPHSYFGTLLGEMEGTIFIVFPRLYNREKGNYIYKKHLEQFYDRILRPAMHKLAHPAQYASIPRSQAMADTDARAKANEQQCQASGRKSMHHFRIPRSQNAEVWKEMMRTIESVPELGHFRGAFLVFDAKNTKANWQKVSLYHAMDAFDDDFEEHFDEAHIQEMVIDLGGQIAAASPEPCSADGRNLAVTYGWKRCCLERLVKDLISDGLDGKRPRQSTVYTVANLWDMACLTLEPRRRCYLYRGGLRYMQLYNLVKALLEALGCYPFDQDSLDEICVDDLVFALAASAEKASHSRKRGAPFEQFGHGKHRVRCALTCSEIVSYGLRFELRVQRELWRAIKRRAKAHHNRSVNTQDHFSGGPPEAAWTMSTSSFMRYLQGNYDKYISLLEICSTTTPRAGRNLARCQFMRVVLQCLRGLMNCDFQRFPALWTAVRDHEGGRLHGLGFETTLRRYGYCWIQANTIDWELLRFQSHIGCSIAGFSNKEMLAWHPGTNELIRNQSVTGTELMEVLDRATPSGQLEEAIVLILAHEVMRQYRVDVLDALASETRTDAQALVMRDQVAFSSEGWKEILTSPPNLVNGGKAGTKTPEALFTWLWGESGGQDYPRKHIDTKPYRRRLATIRNALKAKGVCIYGRFMDVLFKDFFTYHWCIPYPHYNGTFIAKSKGTSRRQMFSVVPNSTFTSFAWGKRSVASGRPGPYPAVCLMTPDARTRHLTWLEQKDMQTLEM